MTQPHDDEYGDILRRVLRAEADEITPSAEGLERIRAGVDARSARRMWWQMPWVRPAMAVGGALVVAAVVMAGTPSIRQSVASAFRPSTPSASSNPYNPPTRGQGSPTTGATTGSPSPTNSGGPSQAPGGGPCGEPGGDDDSGGQVTILRTPSASESPSDCATTSAPDTPTEDPTAPSTPTTRPTSPPPTHTTPPPDTPGSPTTEPNPTGTHPDPTVSP